MSASPAPLVLVADNDAAVSAMLMEFLQRVGCRVRQAFDGAQAMALALDPELRVLVCDLEMPRASGVDVLEHLARSAHRPPPTIVITGFLEPAVEIRLRRLPFVRELLRKPFDPFQFAARVRRLADEAVPGAEASAT